MFFIVANKDDFSNTGNFCNGAKTVPDDRVACYIEERLEEDFSLAPLRFNGRHKPWVHQETTV